MKRHNVIIAAASKQNIWYASRIGECFNAVLEIFPVRGYRIAPLFFVYEHDAAIAERQVTLNEMLESEMPSFARPEAIYSNTQF